VQVAFGAHGEPELLADSSGGVWRVGELVLKRAPDPGEAAFVGQLSVRLPMVVSHVPAADGAWTHDGWAAMTYVHGDLAANVLFTEDAPVVIDLSPYHRPAAFARAITVLDQVCWHQAPAKRARTVDDTDLHRAIVFRVVAAALHSPRAGAAEAERARVLVDR
jgi:hypothetical protein